MKNGEIKKLGHHKLMCGDATNKDHLNQLIDNHTVNLLLTDPPYGINIVQMKTLKTGNKDGKKRINAVGGGAEVAFNKSTIGGVGGAALRPFRNNNGTIRGPSKKPTGFDKGRVGYDGIVQPREYYPIIGDDKPFNPQHLLDLNVPSILFGANNYASKLKDHSKWLVWYKNASLDGNRNYFSDCELAWTNIKGKSVVCYHHTWSGMVRAGDRDVELSERIHPTQKPVGLLMDIIKDFTEPDDIVLDPYGGSGSTLIACELLSRNCLMMELSEHYCDMIVKRFNDLNKGQTRLL